MRALLAAIMCHKGEVEANLVTHLELIEQAARDACDIVVFPEFSLTGAVDPIADPERAIALDDPAVTALTAATREHDVTAVFGISERVGDGFFITQAVATDGALVGAQRKRHLGEDETGYATASDTFVFTVGERRVGIIICAESGVDSTWDATRDSGAEIVLFCSAPGLYGRRTNEASWRAGFEWWEGCGLRDARRHARRLRVPVAMATQAGSTIDEDFPGIAALISPGGEILDRLPDWNSGTLAVDV
jgi:predicted amidohydrolase